MALLHWLHRLLVSALHLERRFEPFFRPFLNRILREPTARCLQWTINLTRQKEGLGLAEEKLFEGEEAFLDEIVELMKRQMRGRFKPGKFERGGNTKTHGILQATLTIHDGLPANLARGVFARRRTFPAYVRFSGPGPDVPADIKDVGFLSMSVKLMGVPGPKLMEDEKHTQDFLAVCTPTFTTPDTPSNVRLQVWSLRDLGLFYFLDPRDSHLRDLFMHGLWTGTQYNPLGERYWSTVPYLLGGGQAMMYSFVPKSKVFRDIPGLPFGKVPFNYLRENMVKTLDAGAVEFELKVQVQTDAFHMPIENASVRWPEKRSPFVTVATLHIPVQTFDTPERAALAQRLSFNPWHCLPAHRPLGNQNRARRRLYQELSRFRQTANGVPQVEPTGDPRVDGGSS